MKLFESAKVVLSQLGEVIEQLDENHYSQAIPRLGNSTIGQHTRHTLEFFICLLEGVTDGVINYDHRNRDRNLEINPQNALTVTRMIQDQLSEIKPKLPLKLEVDYGLEGEETQPMDTNYSRELAYNIEHAVHHMAIIKIGLSEIPADINIPFGFGIAVSTLRYRKEQVQDT